MGQDHWVGDADATSRLFCTGYQQALHLSVAGLDSLLPMTFSAWATHDSLKPEARLTVQPGRKGFLSPCPFRANRGPGADSRWGFKGCSPRRKRRGVRDLDLNDHGDGNLIRMMTGNQARVLLIQQQWEARAQKTALPRGLMLSKGRSVERGPGEGVCQSCHLPPV